MFKQPQEESSPHDSHGFGVQAQASTPYYGLPGANDLKNYGSNLKSTNQIQQVSKDIHFQNHCKIFQQVGPARIVALQDKQIQLQSSQDVAALKNEARCLKSQKNLRRNLYPNVMKSTLKKILEDKNSKSVFSKKLNRICQRVGYELGNFQLRQFKDYCKNLPREFVLKDIKYYMDYNQGSSRERKMKKVLNQFFVWFLSKRYTIQVLKSTKCKHKKEYIEGKNELIFLQ